MRHSPSDTNPLPTGGDLERTLVGRQPLNDGRPISPLQGRDQTISVAWRTPRKQLQVEHVACHPKGQSSTNFVDNVMKYWCPVNRLPPEVLACIFELCVAPFEEYSPDAAASCTPLRLTQVCKLWRAVAESDPCLWTFIRIHLHGDQDRGEDVSRVRPLFDLHLKTSGTLPISLTFTDFRAYHSDTKDLISLLVHRLQEYAWRWKHISLQLPGSYFPLLFTFAPCDLFSLEHFSIDSESDMTAYLSTPLCLDLESAKNLKSFSYGGPGPAAVDVVNLNWGGLSDVSFEFVPRVQRRHMISRRFANLAQCQNITTCSLGVGSSIHWTGPGRITLLHLHTLQIRRIGPQVHARFVIGPLILPHLQRLEVDAAFLVGWSKRWHDHDFSSLLERSGCSLLNLSIQDVDFPDEELMRCLKLSPALTSFRFIPCPRWQDVTNIIRYLEVRHSPPGVRTGSPVRGKEGTDVILPQLREIRLGSSKKEYLDSMMAMFQSRTGARTSASGFSALQRAEVVFFDLWHDTDEYRPGGQLEGTDLAQWVSWVKGQNEMGDRDQLEASVVVDMPYLPEYGESYNGFPLSSAAS